MKRETVSNPHDQQQCSIQFLPGGLQCFRSPLLQHCFPHPASTCRRRPSTAYLSKWRNWSPCSPLRTWCIYLWLFMHFMSQAPNPVSQKLLQTPWQSVGFHLLRRKETRDVSLTKALVLFAQTRPAGAPCVRAGNLLYSTCLRKFQRYPQVACNGGVLGQLAAVAD